MVELSDQFIERCVSGVFFAPFETIIGNNEINQSIAQRFSNAGIPVVLLDRDSTLLSVPLTTIHQSARDIAVAAYRAMLDRIAEPTLPTRTILLSPRLGVRESCGVYLHYKTK